MMRHAIISIAIFGMSTGSAVGEIDVYLLGGQSNMNGIAKIVNLPPDVPKAIPHTLFWNSRGGGFQPLILGKTSSVNRPGIFGPEVGFGLGMAAADNPIYLIKYSASGMPLHHGWSGGKWVGGEPTRPLSNSYPGEKTDDPNRGKHYRLMLRKFQVALRHLQQQGNTPAVKGFVWMQGEQDSKHQTSATAYATSLKRLRRRLSEDLGLEKNLPIVFGQVLPHEPAASRFTHRNEIRAQMAAADMSSGKPEAMENARMITTDGFGLLPDTVHYNADGQLRLGREFAAAMKEIPAVTAPAAATDHQPAKSEGAKEGPARPQIIKTGTIDVDVVEGHNFVWQGRLLREQWCKNHYKGERGLPGSHISIRDVQTGKLLASLAQDHAFGTVYVEDGTAYIVATYDKPGPNRRKQVNLFASKDLKNWDQWNVIDDPQFNICNTSLIKAGDEYILMFEISRPNVTSWTARFAESKDLKKWEILPEEYIHGRQYMAAPHCLKYHDGYFYNFYVRNRYGYSTFVARSRDLKNWEESPLNPVMRADDDDRKLAPGVNFTEEQKQRIAAARDINNSDIDILEHEGKCLISYSWGNQHGTEHLAAAVYDGPLASFLEGWFPGTSE